MSRRNTRKFMLQKYIRYNEYANMLEGMQNLFGASSHPTRLRVLNLLARGGREFCVCELVEILKVPQSTLSRLLMPLRQSGIVQAERAGQWVHYKITPLYRSYIRMLLEKCPTEKFQLESDLERATRLQARNRAAASYCTAKRRPSKKPVRQQRQKRSNV